MSLMYSMSDVVKKINEWDAPATIKNLMKERQWSLRELSSAIGMHENYLSQQMNRESISIPLLFVLSIHLQRNMFEYVIRLLPSAVQSTKREADLETEIARLTAELADVKKERDIYKEIVVKRNP